MSKKTPQAIRGTQDIFGADAEAFAFVVETFERVRRLYRFRRVEMPVFEKTEVFARSLGETTDVVSKEMYSFEDRGGESLTLRPEFTAGIARAFLTNGWQQYAPLKVATHGPLFRYERPQKGRYRQFHQIDAEVIGAGESPKGQEGGNLSLTTSGGVKINAAYQAAYELPAALGQIAGTFRGYAATARTGDGQQRRRESISGARRRGGRAPLRLSAVGAAPVGRARAGTSRRRQRAAELH